MPAWTLPRSFVERLRREFPQHTFVDVWDRDALRQAPARGRRRVLGGHRSIGLSHRCRGCDGSRAPAAGVGDMLSDRSSRQPDRPDQRARRSCPRHRRARARRHDCAGAPAPAGHAPPGRARMGARRNRNERLRFARCRTAGWRSSASAPSASRSRRLAAGVGMRVSAIRKRDRSAASRFRRRGAATGAAARSARASDVVVLSAPLTAGHAEADRTARARSQSSAAHS